MKKQINQIIQILTSKIKIKKIGITLLFIALIFGTIIHGQTFPYPLPDPLHTWDFESTNSQQGLSGTLESNASLQNGKLKVNTNLSDPNPSYLKSSPLAQQINSHSLLVWVKLDNLTQRGGGAMTIQRQDFSAYDEFNSIVYSEINNTQWMVGSSGGKRWTSHQTPVETESSKYLFMAATYQDDGTNQHMKLYRNGVQIDSNTHALSTYFAPYSANTAQILFGIRHREGLCGVCRLQAEIEHAMFFNSALSPNDIMKIQNQMTVCFNECEQCIEGYGCIQCKDSIMIPPDCTHDKNLYYISEIDPNTYTRSYKQKILQQCKVPNDQYNLPINLPDPQYTVNNPALVKGILPFSVNKAYQFNGSSDFIQLNNFPIYEKLSISFWSKFDTLSINSRIFDCGNGLGVDNFIITHEGSTNVLKVIQYRKSQENSQVSNTGIQIGVWEQWTVTSDLQGNIIIYKNGLKVNANESIGYTDKGKIKKNMRNACFIGKSNNPGDSYFKGQIEELRVYSRVLSTDEITCLASAYGYCDYKCGICNQDGSCQTCSDINRDISKKCECKEGYVNVGLNPQCQQNCVTPWDQTLNGQESTNYGTVDGSGPVAGLGKAIYFDGTGVYRNFGNTDLGGDITVSVWAKFDEFNNWSRIMDFGNDNIGSDSFNINNYGSLTNNNFAAALHDNSSHYLIKRAISINKGKWHQWTVTFSASGQINIHCFGRICNKIEQNTGVVGGIVKMIRTNSYLGKSYNPPDDNFKGSIFEFRLYERILNQNEITCLGNMQFYCKRQCLTCTTNYDVCDKCIGSNRGLPSCECVAGFYENGESIDCVSIFPCSSRVSTFKVLANTGFGAKKGQYFHFSKADVDTILGRTDWNEQRFNLVNIRTGVKSRIILYRTDSNGAGQGDAYGHQEVQTSRVLPDTAPFLVDDILDFTIAALCTACVGSNRQLPYCSCKPGYYSTDSSADCKPLFPCSYTDSGFEVKSIEHPTDSVATSEYGFGPGRYFHFNKEDLSRILKRNNWGSEEFDMVNMRSGQIFRLLLQDAPNGGSVGTAHGRPLKTDPRQYLNNFQVGDRIDFMDGRQCQQCISTKRQTPSCQCDYGYQENGNQCDRIILTGCRYFVHIESLNYSSGYIRMYLNNNLIALPTNGSGNHKGITLVMFKEHMFEVEQTAIFDIDNNAADLTNLINFINNVPNGRVVLVGVMNTVGSPKLDSTGIAALQLLGASPNIEIEELSAYTLIGMKGATQGSRPESYQSRYPTTFNTRLYETHKEIEAHVQGCLDDVYLEVTGTCPPIEKKIMFDGVLGWTDRVVYPTRYLYKNQPNEMMDGIVFSGLHKFINSPECQYNVNTYGRAYIFFQEDQLERTYDGDIDEELNATGWTQISGSSHSMIWAYNYYGYMNKMVIYYKDVQTSFKFPQVETIEFKGGVSFTPIKCHYSCRTCKGTGQSDCLSCSTLIKDRQSINASNQCLCADKFYDNGTHEKCFACHYSCKTCSGPLITDCLSCSNDTTNFRQLPSVDKKCLCQDKYYDDSTNEKCQKCHYSCKTCSGPLITDCISCSNDSINFRQTLSVDKKCLCQVKYFDDSVNEQCQQCHFSCKQCSGPLKTDCLDCSTDSIINRMSVSGTKECLCKERYFDDNTNEKCQSCHYSCKSCNGPSDNQCLTCSNDSIYFRDILSVDKKCKCLVSYYDDGSNEKCSKCHYSCYTCNGSSKTDCLTCTTDITLNREGAISTDSKCLCKPKFYDDSINMKCLSCHYSCKSCIGPLSNQCLYCSNDNTLFRKDLSIDKKCLCQDTYYDDSFNEKCLQCDMSCQNCTGGTNNDCVSCQSGYYKDGTKCLVCVYPCQTCNSSSVCLSCINSLGRIPPDCNCDKGYFSNSVNSCERCSIKCKECTGNSEQCIVGCSHDSRDFSKQCACKDGFYESFSQNCLPCQYPCANCSGANVCLTCMGANRIAPKKCICSPGYFYNNQICEKCNSQCLECKEKSDQCISCGIAENRSQIPPNCPCLENYYKDKITGNCILCMPQCKECSQGNQCLSCQNSNLSPPNCISQIYNSVFIVVEGKITDQQCQPQCEKCENSSINCTQCIEGRYRNNSPPFCDCFHGYHDENKMLKDCKKCPITCDSCISEEQCISCKISQNRQFNQFQLSCDCLPKYKEVYGNPICQKCYAFKGNCVLKCPQYTAQNEIDQSCDNIDIEKQNNIYLIYLCGIFIILFLIGKLFSFFIKGPNKNSYQQKIHNLQNNNSKNDKIGVSNENKFETYL